MSKKQIKVEIELTRADSKALKNIAGMLATLAARNPVEFECLKDEGTREFIEKISESLAEAVRKFH